MVEHSENEIYAVTCRMEHAIVNDSRINPVYMMVRWMLLRGYKNCCVKRLRRFLGIMRIIWIICWRCVWYGEIEGS